MALLISIIIILIVAALVIYAVDQIPLAPPFGNIIRVLIILLAALLIISKAGLM